MRTPAVASVAADIAAAPPAVVADNTVAVAAPSSAVPAPRLAVPLRPTSRARTSRTPRAVLHLRTSPFIQHQHHGRPGSHTPASFTTLGPVVVVYYARRKMHPITARAPDGCDVDYPRCVEFASVLTESSDRACAVVVCIYVACVRAYHYLSSNVRRPPSSSSSNVSPRVRWSSSTRGSMSRVRVDVPYCIPRSYCIHMYVKENTHT
jgi:hypothetical protein